MVFVHPTCVGSYAERMACKRIVLICVCVCACTRVRVRVGVLWRAVASEAPAKWYLPDHASDCKCKACTR